MNDVVLYLMKNTIPILGGITVLITLIVLVWMVSSRRATASRITAPDVRIGEERPRRKIVEKNRYAEARTSRRDVSDSERMKVLLTMCMGDREKADRLIQFEMGKSPAGDQESWIDEAIKRWGRDLHRL